MLQVFKALGPVDLRSVRRDAMLQWAVFIPIVAGLAMRYLMPFLAQQINLRFGFDLMPWLHYFAPMLVMMTPMIMGMIVGFLLLDQRDDQSLTALMVTPLSLQKYLLYRISVPMVMSFLGGLVVLPLANLEPVSFVTLLGCSLVSAPLAPMFALFWAVAAKNKVQGMAVMKLSGVILLPAMAVYFIPSAWGWLLGVFPTFWSVQVYRLGQLQSPLFWLALVGGLLVQVFCLLGLMKFYRKTLHVGG